MELGQVSSVKAFDGSDPGDFQVFKVKVIGHADGRSTALVAGRGPMRGATRHNGRGGGGRGGGRAHPTGRGGGEAGNGQECWRCGEIGHFRRDCRSSSKGPAQGSERPAVLV